MSLKLEALGFATMAEIPLVVVNVQRGGPSTGIPTQVEQSDLLQAIWGSHGDAPRPVLAASSVEDCYHLAVEAVTIAREYSTPVVLLSDQILATRIQAFPTPDLSDGLAPGGPDLSPRPEGFKPYALGETTRHAPPGTRMLGGAYPTVTGLEHDEMGKPSPTPEMHRHMTAKRREKLLRLRDTLPPPLWFGGESGDLLLVGWGSSFGPIREAVLRMRASGREVSHCHLRHLHPLPPGLGAALARFRSVVTVEMNDGGLYGCGQLAYHLRATCGRPDIESINKTEGLAFKVREIVDGAMPRLTPPVSTPT
jgi:2-oxoglutarate ferredoxin oxidoreductase subunit alpha